LERIVRKWHRHLTTISEGEGGGKKGYKREKHPSSFSVRPARWEGGKKREGNKRHLRVGRGRKQEGGKKKGEGKNHITSISISSGACQMEIESIVTRSKEQRWKSSRSLRKGHVPGRRGGGRSSVRRPGGSEKKGRRRGGTGSFIALADREEKESQA